MPSVPSAGPGPGAEECGAVSGAGAGRRPSSGRPLGQHSLLLLRVPYGTHVSSPTRCWRSVATDGMTRKASLWARPSCPSRASREPCGGPGLWEPQAAWLPVPLQRQSRCSGPAAPPALPALPLGFAWTPPPQHAPRLCRQPPFCGPAFPASPWDHSISSSPPGS